MRAPSAAVPGAADYPQAMRMTARQRREMLEAWLFLSPWVVGFVLFTAGPIVASLVLSFCDYDVITPPAFAGLSNYVQLSEDRLLRKSLFNTIVYAAMYVPLAVAVALGLALLLNQQLPGMRIFRTIFYLPTLTQGVATFALWAVVFEPQTGPINRALRGLGISDPPRWLSDPTWTKPALVIMAVWSVGGMMIIFLAGLQNIPRQLYEAAEIDGASPVRRFLHVTAPMLSPTIFFNVIVSTIAALQVFAAAFVLTGVGPAHSTLFYVYHLFKKAFEEFRMGYASAMAWLLFTIVLVMTLLQMHLGKRWVHYE